MTEVANNHENDMDQPTNQAHKDEDEEGGPVEEEEEQCSADSRPGNA